MFSMYLAMFSPAFGYWLNIILLLISGLTMFMAGLGANFEFDLKSIMVLSTLSQLGLMIMNISIGLSGLAFFHLLTHALFKALLFMCVIHFIHVCYSFYSGLSSYLFYSWLICLYTFYFLKFNSL